jgi:hypothetical protein
MARNFNYPPKKLEDHPLLVVHNCLINMYVSSHLHLQPQGTPHVVTWKLLQMGLFYKQIQNLRDIPIYAF